MTEVCAALFVKVTVSWNMTSCLLWGISEQLAVSLKVVQVQEERLFSLLGVFSVRMLIKWLWYLVHDSPEVSKTFMLALDESWLTHSHKHVSSVIIWKPYPCAVYMVTCFIMSHLHVACYFESNSTFCFRHTSRIYSGTWTATQPDSLPHKPSWWDKWNDVVNVIQSVSSNFRNWLSA
jgi:hypothetical protein